MTSRISFSKLLKEEIRHQMISVFVVVLVLAADLLFFNFDVQSFGFYTGQALKMESLVAPDFNKFIPSMLLAVVLAVNSFSYLHSQKKTDFYMSLPVRRSTQYFMGMAVSAVIFFIPSVVELLTEIVIVLPTGYISTVFFANLMWGFLCKCLAFAVVWTSMTLLMIMTGHLVVAVFGLCAICAYMPLILYELYPTLAGMLYETFYQVGKSEMPWYFLSPISLMGCLGNYYDLQMEKFYIYLSATLMFILVTGTFGWKLYQKRAAEAAGRAMAFPKICSVVRWMIVVPIALYFGYFLEEISMMGTGVWLVAGTIVGVVLLHGIIESIYEFDLKCMLKKKKQLVAEILLCLGVLAGFYFTADMYNAYIPEYEDVESVKLVMYDDNMHLYDVGNIEGVHEEQVQAVISLAERIVQQNSEKDLEDASKENEDSLGTIYVKYKMKNGREKGRQYKFSSGDEENRRLLDQIVGTEDFKDDFFEIFTVPDDVVKEIEVDNSFDSQTLWLTEEEKSELLEIYRKELASLTYTEMKQGSRYAQLSFKYEYEYGPSYWDNDCYIYESFDKTIAFLKKHGIIVENPMNSCKVLLVEFEERYDDMGTEAYEIEELEAIASVEKTFSPVNLYGNGYVDRPEDTKYICAEVKIDDHIEKRYFFIGSAEEEILIKAANER